MDWGALLTAVRNRMDEDPEQRRRAALVAMRSMPQEGPEENTRAKLDGAGLPAADLTGESPHADSPDMGYLYGRDDRAFRTPPFLPPGHNRIGGDAPRLNLPAADLSMESERRPWDESLPGPLNDLVKNPRSLLLPPYDPSKFPERLGASEDTQAVQPLPAVPGLVTKRPTVSPGTIDALIRKYDEQLAGQPNRKDEKYKPQRMKTWQTVAGAALATLAGAGSRNPRLAGELASDVFNTPKREADERFDRDVADWRRVMEATRNRLGAENVASEIRDRDAHADAYADWRSQDRADLKALHAAAVEKAMREGRDPASDPTVQRYGDAITSLQREPGGRTETPFSVWRQQNPNAPVADYFKLAPEARAESRPPEKPSRLTAGQKATAARRYKQELRDIENERRLRESGDYVDHRTGQMLPPVSEEELNRRKQDAEDAYKGELEAGGESVNRYDYGTRRYEGQEQEQPSARGRASAGTQHQVGDVVTYKGKQYRIGGIRGGRAQLVPLGQ